MLYVIECNFYNVTEDVDFNSVDKKMKLLEELGFM